MPKKDAKEKAVEEKVLTPIEKCQVMHDKKMSEDEIIGALAEHDGMSIMQAVGVFKKFQKSAGLILSKEDRVTKIGELIEGAVTTTTEEDDEGDDILVKRIDVKVASDALMKDLSISAGAAKGHIRRYCKANDVVMPDRKQIALDALGAYKDTVVKGIKSGKTKVQVIEQLIEAFGDPKNVEEGVEAIEDEKAAKRIYTRIAKAEGLSSSRGSQDHTAVIAFLKEHGSEYATKDGLANALVAELDITMSAAKRVWGLFSFVKQFNAVEEAAAE